MQNTDNSAQADSKVRDTVDIALQLIPAPPLRGESSMCGASESVSTPPFDGVGGGYAGAGASDGWADRAAGETPTRLADTAGSAGASLVDAISVLLPF
jgi:hypothetical protein